jgi:ABC-type transport system involved in multi-copper enzyme maturation permease subunit
MTLVGHGWRRHRTALLFLAAGLLVFAWLVTRLAPDPAQTVAIRQLIQLLPAPMLEMFGNEMADNLNPRGSVSFGYAHPFAIVLPAAWAIRVSAGAMAGEIGIGTMDLIASRAVPRWATVLAGFVTLALGLALITACGWIGTAIGTLTRPMLGLEAAPFLRVTVMQWLLFLAFGAVGLLISANRRASGPVIGIMSAVVTVSFALQYLAKAWKPIEWMLPGSLFTYYHPQALSLAGFVAGDVAALAGVTVVATAAAFIMFARRDL